MNTSDLGDLLCTLSKSRFGLFFLFMGIGNMSKLAINNIIQTIS